MLTNNGKFIKKISAIPTMSYAGVVQNMIQTPEFTLRDILGNELSNYRRGYLLNTRSNINIYDVNDKIYYGQAQESQFTTDKESQQFTLGYYAGITILCGSSNTPEDVNDYRLGDCIQFSGYNVDKTLQIRRDVEDNNNFLICRQFINNTGAEQTIREIGLYTSCRQSNQYTSNNNDYILLARKVLDTPIVVPYSDVPFMVAYSLKNDIE